MADVEALCERVIVIHHGTLLYDGGLPGLVRTFSPHKTIIVELEEDAEVPEGRVEAILPDGGELVARTPIGLTIRVPKAETAHVASRLLSELPVADLTIEDPPIEEVIESVFASPGNPVEHNEPAPV
jgi:ABC-2 type transport system ATP-binding protein